MMVRDFNKIALLDFIKRRDVIQSGKFTLASGKESDVYVNSKKITLDAEGLHVVIPSLYQKMREVAAFDAVGGLTLGADPLIGGLLYYSALYQTLNLKGFIVRKEPKDHGTKSLIEGPVEPGMKVAIVEDVATTGGSAMKAVEAAIKFGLIPVVIGAVINRKEGADELFKAANIPFVWLADKD